MKFTSLKYLNKTILNISYPRKFVFKLCFKTKKNWFPKIINEKIVKNDKKLMSMFLEMRLEIMTFLLIITSY